MTDLEIELLAALKEAEGALRGASFEFSRIQGTLSTAHPVVRACEIGLNLGNISDHYFNKADEIAAAISSAESR